MMESKAEVQNFPIEEKNIGKVEEIPVLTAVNDVKVVDSMEKTPIPPAENGDVISIDPMAEKPNQNVENAILKGLELGAAERVLPAEDENLIRIVVPEGEEPQIMTKEMKSVHRKVINTVRSMAENRGVSLGDIQMYLKYVKGINVRTHDKDIKLALKNGIERGVITRENDEYKLAEIPNPLQHSRSRRRSSTRSVRGSSTRKKSASRSENGGTRGRSRSTRKKSGTRGRSRSTRKKSGTRGRSRSTRKKSGTRGRSRSSRKKSGTTGRSGRRSRSRKKAGRSGRRSSGRRRSGSRR